MPIGPPPPIDYPGAGALTAMEGHYVYSGAHHLIYRAWYRVGAGEAGEYSNVQCMLQWMQHFEQLRARVGPLGCPIFLIRMRVFNAVTGQEFPHWDWPVLIDSGIPNSVLLPPINVLTCVRRAQYWGRRRLGFARLGALSSRLVDRGNWSIDYGQTVLSDVARGMAQRLRGWDNEGFLGDCLIPVLCGHEPGGPNDVRPFDCVDQESVQGLQFVRTKRQWRFPV